MLCEHCKRAGRITSPRTCAPTASTSTGDDRAFEPGGCSRCGGTGYKGRIGLYEVMPVDEEMRQLVVARASSDEIAALAVAQRACSACARTAWPRPCEGLTSFAEVARVTA